MTLPAPETIRKLSGREVLSLAIARLRERAEHGRATADAYGVACDRSVLVDAEIWDALANGVQAIANRAEMSLETRSKDKDGKPTFASRLRYEAETELAQIFAGALRAAFATSFEPGTREDVAA